LYTGFYTPDLRHQDGVKIATLPLVTKSSLVPYYGGPQCYAIAQHQRRCSLVVLPAAAGMGGFCDTITKAIVSTSNPYHVDEMIYT
jgi:hypothetical protein